MPPDVTSIRGKQGWEGAEVGGGPEVPCLGGSRARGDGTCTM